MIASLSLAWLTIAVTVFVKTAKRTGSLKHQVIKIFVTLKFSLVRQKKSKVDYKCSCHVPEI